MKKSEENRNLNMYDRRTFLKIAGMGTAGALAFALPGFKSFESVLKKKPNIIFILADDLGYGDLGCYGQTKIKTPFLDKMAIEGIRFTSAYCGSAVCAPSRCTLMTGYHTGHCSVRQNFSGIDHGRVPLNPGDITVAQVLKRAGYKTGMCGKWGLGEAGTDAVPNKKGFDYFFGYLDQREAHNYYPEYLWENEKKVYLEKNKNGSRKTYSQDMIFEKSLGFLKRNKDNPFFLYLPFTVPHAELAVPEDSLDEYKGKFPETPYEQKNNEGYHSQKYPHAAYAAMITRMDKQIGIILKKLKEYEIDDNTMVFFSSDNGPSEAGGIDPKFFDSNGILRGGKHDLYEGGIRMPMIVRYPGQIKAGMVSDEPWAFWDFLPTVAALTDAKAPSGLDGISMVRSIMGRPQKTHEYFYWEFREGKRAFKQAVRKDDWKGVRLNPDKPIELYNLKEDIGEKNDIAKDYPDIVKEIEQIFLIAHVENRNWPMPIETSNKTVSETKNKKKKQNK